MTMSSVRQAGRVFHLFSVEVGKTGLSLADGSDRRIEARDIHVSSPNRGDDYYTAGCGSASQAQDRWSTYYGDI